VIDGVDQSPGLILVQVNLMGPLLRMQAAIQAMRKREYFLKQPSKKPCEYKCTKCAADCTSTGRLSPFHKHYLLEGSPLAFSPFGTRRGAGL